MLKQTFKPYKRQNIKNAEYSNRYPNKVEFNNLLEKEHDYFQVYIDCKLEDENEIVFGPSKSFFIKSNDKYFMIEVDGNGLDRTEVAIKIVDVLIKISVHDNLKDQKKFGYEPDYPLYDYASGLSVHGLVKIKEKMNKMPVYEIDLSS